MIMLNVSKLLLLKAVVIRYEINNHPSIIYCNTFGIKDKYLSVIYKYVASSLMIHLSNIDARQTSMT